MLRSVEKQTVAPASHIVIVDETDYVSKMRKLVSMVETEYYVEVDDDDIVYPEHIETLSANLGADLVWTWCDVTGAPHSYNSHYTPGRLAEINYIPSNCAVRTETVERVGGWIDVRKADHPDWNIWRRMETAGATFVNVPKVTWNYRFGLARQLSQR